MRASRQPERLERREFVAAAFRSAVARSEATLKGIAKCAGVSEQKLSNVAQGYHGLTFDLALALQDDVFDRLVDPFLRKKRRGLYLLPEPSEDPVNVIDRFLLTKDSLTQVLVPCTRKKALSSEDAAALEPKLRKLQADAQALIEKCAEARSRHGVMLHDDGEDP